MSLSDVQQLCACHYQEENERERGSSEKALRGCAVISSIEIEAKLGASNAVRVGEAERGAPCDIGQLLILQVRALMLLSGWAQQSLNFSS